MSEYPKSKANLCRERKVPNLNRVVQSNKITAKPKAVENGRKVERKVFTSTRELF